MRILAPIIVLFLSALAPAEAGVKEAARYSAEKGGVSMVVIKDGAAVFEAYPNGGAPEKSWALASGTKSFSGVIAAAAVMDGLLTIDENIAETLPEWRGDLRKSQITIYDLLTLTSGIETTRPGDFGTYASAIAQPASAPPGTVFAYGPTPFQIFGEIMRRKLAAHEGGQYHDAVAYLQARVLDPLDIHPMQWKRGEDGYPRLSMGANLTAREWARFGQFVMQGGTWNGEQLVDAATVAGFTGGTKANAAYGLTWWLNQAPSRRTLRKSRIMRRSTDLYANPRAKALPGDLFMAAGAGKQRLYIIPSRNMVVVRQTPKFFEGFSRRKRFSDVAFLLALLDL